MTAPRTAPVRLERGQALTQEFTLASAGEAWAALTLAAPGTSWLRGTAAVAVLDVDGAEPQHLVLAPRGSGGLPVSLVQARVGR